MVRGVSRRVIVVKPEQPALFEQAIFLVRDYNAPRGDMVREACRIANSYLPRRRRSRRKARFTHLPCMKKQKYIRSGFRS